MVNIRDFSHILVNIKHLSLFHKGLEPAAAPGDEYIRLLSGCHGSGKLGLIRVVLHGHLFYLHIGMAGLKSLNTTFHYLLPFGVIFNMPQRKGDILPSLCLPSLALRSPSGYL